MYTVKSTNLVSLLNAKKDLSSEVFSTYRENIGFSLKENEYLDLRSLVKKILEESPFMYNLDGYFIGFVINQISKEFDLLRFGKDSIINIELKTQSTHEKMKEQLLKNRYYLSFLKQDIFSFTYVVNEDQLYHLDEHGNFKETTFSFLVEKLKSQELFEIDNVHSLFDPTNYLVSPFNSTEEFLVGHYFLTDHQMNIKKEILGNRKNRFFTIQGAPGTGKTLLIYDIAKQFINDFKKILIIHVGQLNAGHRHLKSINSSWEIAPVKILDSYNFKKYDLVIVDETQRIENKQIDYLIEGIKKSEATCIFSYDPQQVLASWEEQRNIPGILSSLENSKSYKLKTKIRTNKEVGTFIKGLFDLSNAERDQPYPNIDVQYFSTELGAKKYLRFAEIEGWKVISYTHSRYNPFPYEAYQLSNQNDAHEVIGQEFDNVIGVLDKYFFYNDQGQLETKGWKTPTYYHQTKMLFQIVSRTRKKLKLVIIDNEEVLREILNILQHNKR